MYQHQTKTYQFRSKHYRQYYYMTFAEFFRRCHHYDKKLYWARKNKKENKR